MIGKINQTVIALDLEAEHGGGMDHNLPGFSLLDLDATVSVVNYLSIEKQYADLRDHVVELGVIWALLKDYDE